MNELIDQNNEQLKTNMQLNERITHLTNTINKIVENSYVNKIILDEIETMVALFNIDSINHLMESIQDAVTLTKNSLVSNKILSLRELNTIKTLLQDQGVEVNFPDEALQFVIPKLALKEDILLYLLNVPQLENTTANVIRIYPLANNDRILHQYPTHIVKRGYNLYTTNKPEDFVQKSSFLSELRDECLASLIHGRKTTCNYVFQNSTTQQLISGNSILISNAKGQMVQSDCGPDNRTLNGNFLITFANCTVTFNGQHFRNNELVSEMQIIQGAFHDLEINWNNHKIFNLEKISNESITNRNKLEHIYLKQHEINIKFWSLLGGFTLVQFICIVSIIIFLYKKIIGTTSTNHKDFGTGRSSFRGRVVTEPSTCIPGPGDIMHQIENIQQQQQQIALAIAALNHQPALT